MIRSVLLNRLINEHLDDRGGLGKGFWREMSERGSPVVERLERDAMCLVTFVYQGDESTSNLLLLSSLHRQDVAPSTFARFQTTDLWYLECELPSATRTRYLISPNDSMAPLTDDDVLSQRSKTVVVDKFNPRQTRLYAFEDDAEDEDVVYSLLELPDATPTIPGSDSGTTRGSLERSNFTSENTRHTYPIWLYEAKGFRRTEGSDAPFLVVFDGWNYATAVALPAILDAMVGRGDIPPLVAVFVDHETMDARNRDLTCNPEFAAFVGDELVPWLRRECGLKSSGKGVAVGSSFGGLAAAYLGLSRNDVFDGVLAQSCSAMWNGEYLSRLYKDVPKKNLSLYLDVGTLEYSHTLHEDSVEVLGRFTEVLEKKGYAFLFRTYEGGHDYACWKAELPFGLGYLLGSR